MLAMMKVRASGGSNSLRIAAAGANDATGIDKLTNSSNSFGNLFRKAFFKYNSAETKFTIAKKCFKFIEIKEENLKIETKA